jgi:predicted dehydrogenase
MTRGLPTAVGEHRDRAAVRPLRVGVVGAGKISGQYSERFLALPQVAVTAVSDLDPARASTLAARHPGAAARPLAALLAADDVDLVLNLTVPAAHAEVSLAALDAGKHVYVEKPLASSLADGREVAAAAQASGLRVGCAPDTVLGTGLQTARAALTRGEIGVPFAATAFMTTPGHELWHPDPEFYYRPGGGPLLDMGPYYLTALVHLLGPVVRVTGLASRPRSSRTIGSGPRQGTAVDVGVDTHVTGVLQHASGPLSTVLVSFDVWAARLPRIEVYGSTGSLSVPDPNQFAGDVEVFLADDGRWRPVPPSDGYLDAGRGVGVADLALAAASGSDHRASLDVGLHVLDVMESLLGAAQSGTSVEIGTSCRAPDPIPGLVKLG